MSDKVGSVYTRIYRCVDLIPAGRVATYGQIADLVGASGPRQVGYALSATPVDVTIPWHRVINARGEISTRSNGEPDSDQLSLLMAEGVLPGEHGRIQLDRYRWEPGAGGFELLEEEEDFWLGMPGVG